MKNLHKSMAFVAALALAWSSAAGATKRYDPGASDTEIRIGNLAPYSGPASAYGTVAKAMGAYFDKVNAQGGINGRKIRYLSLDDGYTPSRSVEQTRKLVEQEQVLLVFGSMGTTQNVVVQKYLNSKKVPQLLLISGAARWGDYQNHPWSMAFIPTLETESRVVARYIRESLPKARIAVLLQNDDFGKESLKGLLEGLGEHKSMVVAQATYELTDPTIDNQIVTLKNSGADVLLSFATPKFAAQAIRKVGDLGWKPVHYVSHVSNSVSTVMKPAGANAHGLLSTTYFRDPTDSRWKGSKELAEYESWMRTYYKEGDLTDSLNVVGYIPAQALVEILRRCGDDLTRENIMKHARSMNMSLPMLLPGIEAKTTPTDPYPIEQMQLIRFNGSTFESVGPVYSGR